MGHVHHLTAVILWISGANIGALAYVFPADLISHEPLPEIATATEGKALMCEPEGVYTKTDPLFCDRYLSCTYGQPVQFECPDGYGFEPFQGCKLLHQVDCGSRTKLQTPKSSNDCPRLNGIYPDLRGCDHYIRCTNGNSAAEICEGRSIFDNKIKSCRNPSFEEYTTCFLQDQKPTSYASFGNQQIAATQNPYQQATTTFNPTVNQQAPTNYNSFVNQQIAATQNSYANQPTPTTFNPTANQQVPTNYNSFLNQQITATQNPYQQATTTFNPTANQQIPTSYNSFANQQVSTTYNPPANFQIPNTQNPSTSVNQLKPPTNNPPTYNQLVSTTYNPPSVDYQMSQYGQTTQYETDQSGSVASSGFVCPPTNFFAFGDHTRYQYPGNCHLFYICLRDGGVKLGGCQAPTAFDPKSKVCVAMQTVSGCS